MYLYLKCNLVEYLFSFSARYTLCSLKIGFGIKPGQIESKDNPPQVGSSFGLFLNQVGLLYHWIL